MLNSFLLKSKSKLKNFVKKGNYISVAKTLLDSSVKKGDLILDIGPGECELLHYLSENFGDTVTLHALDRHESVLKKAPSKTKLIKENLNSINDYYHGIKKYDIPDNSFDVIIMTELIEHIGFPQIFVSEVSRILKEGGVIIITTPNVHMIGNRLAVLFGRDKFFKNNGAEGFITRGNFDQYGHICHYTFDSLKEVLSPYFQIIKEKGAGFHFSYLQFFQTILTKWFPRLSSNICILGKKIPNTSQIKTFMCPLIDAPQLILHDDRCVAVQVHSKTCEKCNFYHKDFLYPGDKRLKNTYIPEYD
tara:strand:+ start:188 stop:1099 length:912 start_codon:yes stop_codon:yes gene_type:complete